MANIKPFKAYFYNKDKVGDLSTVVAPTVYNINDDTKDKLYSINEYNSLSKNNMNYFLYCFLSMYHKIFDIRKIFYIRQVSNE